MKRNMSILLVLLIVLAAFTGCKKEPSKPTRGTWNEDETMYTNEFAELSINMPDGWVAASDEEIAATMNMTSDLLDLPGDAFSEKVLEMQVIMDAILQDPTNGSNLVLNFENLAIAPGGTKIEAEEYLETSKESIEQQMSGQLGVPYEFGDVSTMDIGGNTYSYVDASIEIQGLSMSQRICVRKQGNYMVLVNFTAVGEDLDGLVSKLITTAA